MMSGDTENGKSQGDMPHKKTEPQRRMISLDLLMMLFGMGAWVGVNGSYVQFPILVDLLPESWTLGSNMAVVIQIANIGPLAYSAVRYFAPKFQDKYSISGVLALGTIAMVLMSFLYPITTIVGGQQRSVAFLTLVFFTALVGCTSSVLFYPYLRHYKDIYLITYLVGEGLSGLLPSMLALVQGVGGHTECVLNEGVCTSVNAPPRFEPKYFLLAIAGLSFLSFLAFLIISSSSKFDSEKVNVDKKKTDEMDPIAEVMPEKSLLSTRYLCLFCLIAVVNAFGNGIFPSVQTYSSRPYGNMAYHLAVTLGAIANPVACFLAVFLPHTSNKAIAGLSSAAAVLAAYILATALLSPTPPLVDSTAGAPIVIVVWVLAVALVSYVKLCISTVFRAHSAKGMFYCGAAGQAGSAVGSLLFFGLVNYANIFIEPNPCSASACVTNT